MEPRRLREQQATHKLHVNRSSRTSHPGRRYKKLGVLIVFVLIALFLVSILWEESAIAPEEAVHADILPIVASEPPLLTPDEVQALEAERERLELELELLEEERATLEKMAFEAAYYSDQSAEKALQSQWTIMPSIVAQGDVLLVRHQEEQEISFGDDIYALSPFGTGYYAYIPIRANMPIGEYPIGDQTITVIAHQFGTQYLEVTSEMESMRRDTERIKADQVKVNEARSHSEPMFLFSPESEFLKPIEGKLTTQFGFTRYVNGVLSSRHMALDLAMPEGTPIMATNDGIVVLSEELYLAGNSIYIDHGMGLFSQYGHLFELHVEVGDEVKQGDIIGLVGTTGFSTGPHLHFAFWAHNVPVNPDLFFGKTPFHWFEEQE